ncbi:MAG TPA: hypothetical protein VJZ68_00765 [Nitrososphaera sp.]|nr:hypothetical protein [Nitrososphaera sp.]
MVTNRIGYKQDDLRSKSNMISVQASRKGKREENKGQATNNESNDDKQLQNLLEYLGLGQYPGLIPILRKLGSGTTTTMMIFVSSDIPWII